MELLYTIIILLLLIIIVLLLRRPGGDRRSLGLRNRRYFYTTWRGERRSRHAIGGYRDEQDRR
jgi:preprotein translocase subunit SecG